MHLRKEHLSLPVWGSCNKWISDGWVGAGKDLGNGKKVVFSASVKHVLKKQLLLVITALPFTVVFQATFTLRK